MLPKRSGKAVDEIYKILHDGIMSGKYPPGLRLSQVELANELNTSRTPLREAMNRLQANGLAVASNNRGMDVASVRYEEAEQMYALRLLVEPPLISALVDELTQRDIDTMEAALLEMEASRVATPSYQLAHHRFHSVALMRYPESIREMIEAMYEKIQRHQRVNFSRPHVLEDFTQVDRHFLDAIRVRNSTLVRQWLQFHLLDAALGLAMDIDPEQIPRSLIMAAKGIGIQLDWEGDTFSRPIRISWLSARAEFMPDIETVNLKCFSLKSKDKKTKKTATGC